MQKLRNSQSSEIARRQNVHEQSQLQRKINRYDEEYRKTIKSFLEERQCVREAMTELRRDYMLAKSRSRQTLISVMQEKEKNIKFSFSEHLQRVSSINISENTRPRSATREYVAPSHPKSEPKRIRSALPMSTSSSTTNLKRCCIGQKFRPHSCTEKPTIKNKYSLHMRRHTTIGDHFISLHLGEKPLIQNKKLVRSKDANTSPLQNSILNAKYQCTMEKTESLLKYLGKEERSRERLKKSCYHLSPSTGIVNLRRASEATIAAKTLITMNRKDQAIKKATLEIKDKRSARQAKEEMKKSQQNKFIKVANVIVAAKLLGNRNPSEENDD